MIGTGGALVKVGAPALIQELAHPRLRATIGTMYWGFYHLGTTAAACVSIGGLHIAGEWGWRLPVLLQIVGPITCVAATCTAPESPRWLASMGRLDQVKRILTRHHANGDEADEMVAWEFAEIAAHMSQDDAARRSSYVRGISRHSANT